MSKNIYIFLKINLFVVLLIVFSNRSFSQNFGAATGTIKTDLTCIGKNDGTIKITPTMNAGKSGGYTFSVSTQPMGSNILDLGTGTDLELSANSLLPGNYEFNIDTLLGNSPEVVRITITEPTAVTGTITAKQITCNGADNGELSVVASGGTGVGYTYVWSNGSVEDRIMGLTSGTYNLTITDGNNCESSQLSETIIVEPTAIKIDSIQINNEISCNGAKDGVLQAVASGGTLGITGGYRYFWSEGGGTAAITNPIAAGTYIVTVKDDNNCENTSTFFLPNPDTIMAELIVDSFITTNCIFESINQSFQDGGYTGRISWNLSKTNSSVFDNKSYSWNGPNVNIVNSLSDSLIRNLNDEGNYTSTISYQNKNGNMCIITDTISLTKFKIDSVYANPINICSGDTTASLNFTAFGYDESVSDVRYKYSWVVDDQNSTYTETKRTKTFPGLWASTFNISLNIVDLYISYPSNSLLRCKVVFRDVIEITNPSSIILDSFNVIDSVSCSTRADGKIKVNIRGGIPPYKYYWDSIETVGNNIIDTINIDYTDSTLSNLKLGNYVVTVTDATGCETIIDTFNFNNGYKFNITNKFSVMDSLNCYYDNNGKIKVSSAYGTQPYKYYWDSIETVGNNIIDTINTNFNDSILSNVVSGTYIVTVTDALGCLNVDTFNFIAPDTLKIDNIKILDINCYGQTDRKLVGEVSGGTGYRIFNWSKLLNNMEVHVATDTTTLFDTIFNIKVDTTYILSVVDEKGCTALKNDTFEVVASSFLKFVHDSTKINDTISCFGFSDGDARILISGGSSPYNYYWINKNIDTVSSTILSNDVFNVSGKTLSYDTNKIIVIDANNCEIDSIIIINQPTKLDIKPLTISSNITCFNSSDAVVLASGSGGVPFVQTPYQYDWYKIDKNNTITFFPNNSGDSLLGNLQGGDTVYASISDSNMCISDTLSIQIDSLPKLIDRLYKNYITCSSINYDDGYLEVFTNSVALVNGARFVYSWSKNNVNMNIADTTSNIRNLKEGIYSVTVSLSNNTLCRDSITDILTIPRNRIVHYTAVDARCGLSNGKITIDSIQYSTDANYHLYIDSSVVKNISFTKEKLFLPADTYKIKVVETVSGCRVDTTIIINNIATQISGIGSLNLLCNNDSSGIAWVLPDMFLGDTFQIIWATENNFTNIVRDVSGRVINSTYGDTLENINADTFYVKLINNFGCEIIDSVILTEPDSFIIQSFDTILPLNCYNSQDLSIKVNATGGTNQYTYNWNYNHNVNFTSTSQTFINGDSGTYYVTVTDINMCEIVDTVNYKIKPTQIETSFYTTDPSCFGTNTGQLIVSASEGTPPYTFVWSNSASNSSNVNLNIGSGNYTVTISDLNNCEVIHSATLTDPVQLVIQNVDVLQLPTCGNIDGQVEVKITGGILPYRFIWNTTDTINNAVLNANNNYTFIRGVGTQKLEIIDSNLCYVRYAEELELSNNITNPVFDIDTSIYKKYTSCMEESCQGKLVFDINNFDEIINFFWVQIGSTDTTYEDTLLNVCTNEYFILHTEDINNCVKNDTVYYAKDSLLRVTASTVNNYICNTEPCNGQIQINVFDTGSFIYYMIDTLLNGVSTGGIDSIVLGSSLIQNLCGGVNSKYVIGVKHRYSDCFFTDTVQIDTTPKFVLTIDTINDASCNNVYDGFINITLSEGLRNHIIFWSNTNGYNNTNEDIANLQPDQYNLNVYDILNDDTLCTINSIFQIDSRVEINVKAIDTNYCENLTHITLAVDTVDENANYMWYDLMSGAFRGDTSTVILFTKEDSSTFVVFATKENCVAFDTATIVKNLQPVVDAGMSQSIILSKTVELGANPTSSHINSTYSWSHPSTLNMSDVSNPIATPLENTVYYVTVTSGDCEVKDSVTINIIKSIKLYDAFTPNGDGFNDYWELSDKYYLFPNLTLKIFDKWGSLLYESSGNTQLWDGKYKGELLPEDVYYYVIELNSEDLNLNKPLTGTITLIR